MCSVEQILIQNLQKSKTTIVHSDLGRTPSIIMYYMNKYFQNWNVLYRPFDDEEEEDCDVLIWFEPPFNSVIEKSNHCTIVFTSHLYLKHNETIVSYELQSEICDLLLQTFEFENIWIDITIKPTLFNNTIFTEIYKPSTVYIDLTHCKDIHAIYLCFLNAIENLKYYADFILKWKVSNNALTLLKRYYNFSNNWNVKKLQSEIFIQMIIAKLLKDHLEKK